MAWNEPGNDKDPWDRGGNQQKPPELDEVVKKLQKRFGSVLGGAGGQDVPPIPGAIKFILLGAILVAILFASRFIVDAGSKGVVQRFGEFHHLADPGWNWRIPVIDKVSIVRVDLSQEFDTKNEMLTGDANIISISINVQYRHADAKAFIFNVRDPDDTLQEVTDAAIRAIVGKYDIEFIQRQGRDQVARETRELLQANLTRYGTGIEIDAVNLNNTEFPVQVQDAAQDVIKAARDKERYILQAEAYTNDLIPRARGEAARVIEEARAYRDKLVADANGEAARFLSLLKEYQAAPAVTRERLYLEAVESVLSSTSKVLMDTKGGNNLVYLPVDKLLENSSPGTLQRPNPGSVMQPSMSPSGLQQQNVPSSSDANTSRLRSRDRN
ncbi:MAG: FtsH protease activity modulator HflK [Gammaproteobacteria bacterium]|nr:FtsH protease activity modulator HflK [Gammaproteobacteria bacterium]